MTLVEMTGSGDCSCVPRIDYGSLRFLWVTDFSDAILRSGVLEYAGETCAYELVGEREEGASWYRRFAVLRLSPDQAAEETRWHEGSRQRAGGGRDWDWWQQVYRQRSRPDYSGCEVIGWFEC